MTNLDSILKSRDIILLTKVCPVKAMVFSSSHVWMWQLYYKESINCFWTMALKKTLENPLDCKDIKPVNPKGNQLWIFIGRTDAEASKLWPPDVKNWLIWKVPEAGKDWRQKEKGKQRLNRWMASTWWIWVWASSSHWWWKWRPGVLQSMESQMVGHDWVNWRDVGGKSKRV